ncbi:ATP-binding protein [Lutimaribacter sp. EGI FJ00015]|uniref:ATP-binding protein n=1 Tax=Lutimaribacter degradans TaxID=2945989 RepID=A0ACC5ZTV9_9RHOB|nr:ATP-binding protein [Lutimaribacter sp. EGI FJ00013]MCM2560979.1 ATP-binding protein [Lutimaribacter sp. EGI FJ00013]MCO0612074.1 ATP-binding protein [Lutimaribacter sp. EGI FJ00015]MCO0634806.1 ATP-binding protein [Lutimaribacter sp. EGI FJ00014]
MTARRPVQTNIALGLFLTIVAGMTVGAWTYGYRQALDQLAQRGMADLTLAADRLTGQLQQYQQMAALTADHPALDGPAPRDLLLKAADKTGALDVLLLDEAGQIVASAHETEPTDMANRPVFRRARQGALGEEHGVSTRTGRRAYYFGAPRFDTNGKTRGALVVVANIDRVEAEWRGARPAVFFTDRAGQVFITNRSELLFWQKAGRDGTDGLRPPSGEATSFATRSVGRHTVWIEDWSPYVPARALHLSRDLPVIGMTAQALIDVGPARRLAALQAASLAAMLLAFGAILFWLVGRRRVLAVANRRLESRVAARTSALSAANDRLRREVAERVAAEAALKRAQDELVQAGKLSALGQMSAGISHELNQPLMAIQQYADNGAAFVARGKPQVAAENLGRISDLAARMARIIRNLRAFARNESEPMGRVDIKAVIDSAIDLSAARLRGDGIALEWAAPDGPVWVRGGEVRLGQVIVNLIGNAADAMAESPEKRVRITLYSGRPVCVEIRDTGPGIADPDRIFEPFYTTKAVGAAQGMGLGLSISYGLVQSFGGNIRGANAEDGAVFTVELDPWSEKEQAA